MGALVVMGVLVLPATSFAQATRTWVSGVGDDANPCSRTAPCKTFAGAISKTAAGGEIDALDPGGFGAVTITKSITLSGDGTQASILVAGTNAIVINGPSSIRVNLINLNLDGIDGAGGNSGVNGIDILGAAKVHVNHVKIFGFSQNGINFQSSAAGGPQPRLTVQDSTINNDGGAGILVMSPLAAGERATITNTRLDGDGCGISLGGACGATTGNGNPAVATIIGSTMSNNGQGAGAGGDGGGVESIGSTSLALIGGNTITGNTTGLVRPASGNIFSFGDNYVAGNATNGSPSMTISKMARRHPA